MGEKGEVWQWRRRLLAWEEEQVRECSDSLTNIILQSTIYDRWLWQLHVSRSYNVASVYHYLILTYSIITWNKEVPLKVNLFAWHLFRNRLPTMNNLSRRHILQHNAQPCVGGRGSMEDIDHLFLSFNYFRKIWNDILHWLGLMVQQAQVVDYFYRFETLDGFSKHVRLVFNLIWLSWAWEIWK